MLAEINRVNPLSQSIELGPAQPRLIHDRVIDVSRTVVSLGPLATEQVAECIRSGLMNFYAEHETPEENLANDITGLPTMVARLDATVDHYGNIVPLEVEERPNGVGIVEEILKPEDNIGIVTPIIDHYGSLIGRLPVVLASEQRLATDDSAYLEVRHFGDIPEADQPVLFRAEPSDLEDYPMYVIGNSVSSAKDEGRKAYRTRTGHAKKIQSLDGLPGRDASFVLKGKQGSKSQRVAIQLSPHDRLELGRRVTLTRKDILATAARYIAEDGSVLVEPLRRPIAARVNDRQAHMILRIYSLVTNPDEIRVLGGVHVSREEMLVYGAPHAIIGPVVLE